MKPNKLTDFLYRFGLVMRCTILSKGDMQIHVHSRRFTKGKRVFITPYDKTYVIPAEKWDAVLRVDTWQEAVAILRSNNEKS